MKRMNKLVAGVLVAAMVTGCGTATQIPETEKPAESTEATVSETTVSESESKEASESRFTPGTYDVTASGRNGDVVLHVTFDKDKITDITTENSETVGLGTDAIDSLIKSTLENQTIPIDGISGATISSDAYLEAIKEAVKMVGGNPDEMTAFGAPEKEKQE